MLLPYTVAMWSDPRKRNGVYLYRRTRHQYATVEVDHFFSETPLTVGG